MDYDLFDIELIFTLSTSLVFLIIAVISGRNAGIKITHGAILRFFLPRRDMFYRLSPNLVR